MEKTSRVERITPGRLFILAKRPARIHYTQGHREEYIVNRRQEYLQRVMPDSERTALQCILFVI